MTWFLRVCVAAAAASVVLGAASAGAQGTAADYDRALELRERWQYLTENLADPATWIENTTRFHYRKTVRGGFQFVVVDADTRQKRPAFDHDTLAAALSKASGEQYVALRLPFNSFRFADAERSIEMNVGGRAWTCRLADYACEIRDTRGGRQPRSFGTVRDLEAPPTIGRRPRRTVSGRHSCTTTTSPCGRSRARS